MKRPDDRARVGHIIDAAERVRRWMAAKSREDFDADEMLQSAVVYQLQIIGEAASQLSDTYTGSLPTVPWRQIIGMRHILVHAYMSVDLDIVWEVATAQLTPLLDALRSNLPDSAIG